MFNLPVVVNDAQLNMSCPGIFQVLSIISIVSTNIKDLIIPIKVLDYVWTNLIMAKDR